MVDTRHTNPLLSLAGTQHTMKETELIRELHME